MFTFLRKFLATPWAFLIPLTGICVLVLGYLLGFSSQYLASQYEQQMLDAPEHEIREIAEKIGSLGEPGVSLLVRHLGSSRRVIVVSSRDTLEKEFVQWSQQEPRESSGLNLAFARSLAENIDGFGPSSRLLAASYARRIMKSMLLTPEEKYPQREKIALYCEEIFQKTEGENFVQRNPGQLDRMYQGVQGGEPRQVLAPNPVDVEKLLAANIERDRTNLLQRPQRLEMVDEEYYDPYFAPRAESLYAVHQSRLNRIKNAPDAMSGNLRLPLDSTTLSQSEPQLAAADTADAMFEGSVGANNLYGDDTQPVFSTPREPIASQYKDDEEIPEEEKLPQLPPYEEHKTDLLGGVNSERIPNPYTFEPVEQTALGFTPKEEIEHLRTAELIRLLQHPDRSIEALAERQLRHRDGFQNVHINLALKLYHPSAKQRQELLELLPRTPSVEPLPWLMELLRDPHPEIRLSAITYVATSRDMDLVQNLIEKAKHDDDPRINSLVQKLEKLRQARLTNW